MSVMSCMQWLQRVSWASCMHWVHWLQRMSWVVCTDYNECHELYALTTTSVTNYLYALTFVISSDESLTSCAEFTIQKLSNRTSDPVRRTLCLTETCLVERDPATYSVVTCKPLCDVSFIHNHMLLLSADCATASANAHPPSYLQWLPCPGRHWAPVTASNERLVMGNQSELSFKHASSRYELALYYICYFC